MDCKKPKYPVFIPLDTNSKKEDGVESMTVYFKDDSLIVEKHLFKEFNKRIEIGGIYPMEGRFLVDRVTFTKEEAQKLLITLKHLIEDGEE